MENVETPEPAPLRQILRSAAWALVPALAAIVVVRLLHGTLEILTVFQSRSLIKSALGAIALLGPLALLLFTSERMARSPLARAAVAGLVAPLFVFGWGFAIRWAGVFLEHLDDPRATWRVLGSELGRRWFEQGAYVSVLVAAPLALLELARAARRNPLERALAGVAGAGFVYAWPPHLWILACALLALTAGVIVADARRPLSDEPPPRAWVAWVALLALALAPSGSAGLIEWIERPRRLSSKVLMRLREIDFAEYECMRRTRRYGTLEELVRERWLDPLDPGPVDGYELAIESDGTSYVVVANAPSRRPGYITCSAWRWSQKARRTGPTSSKDVSPPAPDLETVNPWEVLLDEQWRERFDEPWEWLGKAP